MSRVELGISDKEIAKGMGITVTKLRARKAECKEYLRDDLYTQAKSLKEEGLLNIDIAKIMEIKESSVRLILNRPLLQINEEEA